MVRMPQLDNRQLLQSVTRLVEKPDARVLESSLVEPSTRSSPLLSAAAEVGVRVIHPLMTNHGAVGFLVIECEEEVAKDQEIVSILLSFY